MNIIDNLNILDGNINSVKQNLITNLSEKGITVTEGDTLSVMINKVNDIAQGGGIDWSNTGYTEEPKPIADEHSEAAKWYNEWNPANTKLDTSYTLKYPSITVFPKIDTSNVTDMELAFLKSTLEYIPQLNTSNVTNMYAMFSQCRLLQSVSKFDTHNVMSMRSMFVSCSKLLKTPILDITSCTNMSYMFRECASLKEVWFKGDPQINLELRDMFYNVASTGTFYYDDKYYYKPIIDVLPSGWTAVPYDYTDYDADLDWQALGVEEGVNPEQLIFDNTLAFKERYVPETNFKYNIVTGSIKINTPITPSIGNSNTSFNYGFQKFNKDVYTWYDGGVFETGMIPLNGDAKNYDLRFMFQDNDNIRIARVNLNNVTTIRNMFQDCVNLKEIWFKGQPSSSIDVKEFRMGMNKIGTFYYDSRYDYSAIIAVLPTTWTSVAWNYDTNSPA